MVLEEVLLVIVVGFEQAIVFVILVGVLHHQPLGCRVVSWIPLPTGEVEHDILALMAARRRKHIMQPVRPLLKDHFLPGLEGQRYYISHIFARVLQSTNSLDEVVIFAQLIHHALLLQELLVALRAHQHVLQAEHPAAMAVEKGLVLVNVVTHLREHLAFG